MVRPETIFVEAVSSHGCIHIKSKQLRADCLSWFVPPMPLKPLAPRGGLANTHDVPNHYWFFIHQK